MDYACLHMSARKIVNSEIESNSEDDLVITSYSSSQSSGSECEENSEGNVIPVLPLVQQSRSGRIVGTSFSRYRDCYLYHCFYNKY